MKIIKYFIQFIIINIFLIIFKILGYKLASDLGSFLGKKLGPQFRSKKLILNNLSKLNSQINESEKNRIMKGMWSNYGRILSEYVFIKNFRNSDLDEYLTTEGENILQKIIENKKPVIFISGHFNNFELMAMQIEKANVKLATIYRPLNNIFMNVVMENIRKKYICKNQIKKGIPGVREMLQFFKNGHSIALMIDQRVSQGIKVDFFGHSCLTTTIPAQLIKKFECDVIPVYIERIKRYHFRTVFGQPLSFDGDDSVESITEDLNKILEKMIIKNPDQWIWSHNRWK